MITGSSGHASGGKNCTALYGDGCLTAGLVALESISPGKGIYCGMLRCCMLHSKENFPRQRPAMWFLQKIFLSPWYSAVLSFPPEGMTQTSCHCFEYSLHLIEIPSHVNRESIYMTHQPFARKQQDVIVQYRHCV